MIDFDDACELCLAILSQLPRDERGAAALCVAAIIASRAGMSMREAREALAIGYATLAEDEALLINASGGDA